MAQGTGPKKVCESYIGTLNSPIWQAAEEGDPPYFAIWPIRDVNL